MAYLETKEWRLCAAGRPKSRICVEQWRRSQDRYLEFHPKIEFRLIFVFRKWNKAELKHFLCCAVGNKKLKFCLSDSIHQSSMPFLSFFVHRKSHNCTSNVIPPSNSNIKFNKTTHEDNFCVISFSTPEGKEGELPVWIVSIVFFLSFTYCIILHFKQHYFI